MKNYFLSLTTVIALMLTACNNSDPSSLTPQRMVGLWGLSTDEKPDPNGQYGRYFRFRDDGIFEYYEITNGDYSFDRGTFGVDEEKASSTVYIYMSRQMRRMFTVKEGAARYIFDSNDGYYWLPMRYYPLSVSASKIKLKSTIAGYVNMYFHAVDQLPDMWSEEFYAPEVTINDAAVTAQWDQVSWFALNGTQLKYACLYEPEKNGITLLPNGEVGNCTFWMQCLWDVLYASGSVDGYDGIGANSADCHWALEGSVFTLSCAQYTKYKLDAFGNIANYAVVTPANPITREFPIQELTDYYFILYHITRDSYHAFHKHPGSSPSAPQRQPATQQLNPASNPCLMNTYSPHTAPQTVHQISDL